MKIMSSSGYTGGERAKVNRTLTPLQTLQRQPVTEMNLWIGALTKSGVAFQDSRAAWGRLAAGYRLLGKSLLAPEFVLPLQ